MTRRPINLLVEPKCDPGCFALQCFALQSCWPHPVAGVGLATLLGVKIRIKNREVTRIVPLVSIGGQP